MFASVGTKFVLDTRATTVEVSPCFEFLFSLLVHELFSSGLNCFWNV